MFPASSGSQPSDGSLTRIMEQQATLIQHLTERSNESNENAALTRILEQQCRLLESVDAQSGASRQPQIKLSIIKLPTFSGIIEDWKRCADTFKTLIHDSDLSNVQKHQYLIGSLISPAAKTIESIEISDQNYTIAWELLKKRYENERVIRKRHVQCLFETPQVQRESADAIQNLVDHVQKHLKILHSCTSEFTYRVIGRINRLFNREKIRQGNKRTMGGTYCGKRNNNDERHNRIFTTSVSGVGANIVGRRQGRREQIIT